MDVLEYLIRGALLGVTYGLIACPISLVYVTTGSLDLAVGGYAVLAGAIAFTFPGWLGMATGVSAAMLAASAVGGISVVLNRRLGGDRLVVVLASFGFALVLQSLVLTVFGTDPFVLHPYASVLHLIGIRIDPQLLVNAGIGLAVSVAIFLILYKSALGRAMRATSVNPTGASLAGIPVRKVQFATFLLGGALAGLAGILILRTSGLTFASGLPLTISSLGAALLFGLQRPLAAFVGGVAMGVVQSLSAGFAPSQMQSLLPLLFIFVVVAASRFGDSQSVGTRV